MASLWEIDGHLVDDGTSLLECVDCPCEEERCPCTEDDTTVESWEWDVEMTGWANECSGVGGNCEGFNDTFRLTNGSVSTSPGVCAVHWTYEINFPNCCSCAVTLSLISTGVGAPVYLEVNALSTDCEEIFRSSSLGNAPINCADIDTESLTWNRRETLGGFGCGGGLFECPTVGSVTVQVTRVP